MSSSSPVNGASSSGGQSVPSSIIRSHSQTEALGLSGEISMADSPATDEDAVLSRGHPGHLTPEEAATLEALRAQVNPEHIAQIKYEVENDDVVLCRYLRARKFDLNAAATMIRESVARRQQDNPYEFVSQGPDACLDCPESAFKKFYPHYFRGYDKWGRPVLYDQVGKMEFKAVQCVTDVPHMVRYHWWSMLVLLNERYKMAASLGYENLRFGLVSVLDLEGFGLKSMAGEIYSYIKEVASIDQLCFPEMLGKMFIINAPKLFVAAWAIIKGWLDPKTVAKIEIIGSPTVWRPRLALYIPEAEIPRDYGGKAAPLVREVDESGAEYIAMNRHSSLERHYKCVAGQTVRVELYLACGEIEWSVHRVTADSKMVPLAAPSRTPANKEHRRLTVRHAYPITEADTVAVCVKYRNPSSMHQRQFVICNRVESAGG